MDSSQIDDLTAIRPIMVQLMEKRPTESGNLELEDAQRWSVRVQDFFSRTKPAILKQLTTVISPRHFSVAH